MALCCAGVVAAGQRPTGGFGQRTPPRDTPARPGTAVQAEADTELASVSGRVLFLSEGQSLGRAWVTLTARDGSVPAVAVHTDDQGRYQLTGLPAARYTLTASKPGFVTMAYGQRRPGQPPTPIEVGPGQRLGDVDVVLPAGSVITGRVVDEAGAPMPLATVRIYRNAYVQGRPELVPASTDRADDRGQYRVFGLEPGDYYVSAVAPAPRRTSAGRFTISRGLGLGARFGGNENGLIDQDADSTGYAPTYYPGVTRLADASPLRLGLSVEMAGIDMVVRLVPTATVSGVVVGPEGAGATGGQVFLLPDDGAGLRNTMLGGRVQGDGRFEIASVPPGYYTLRAVNRGGPRGGRGGFGRSLLSASRSVVVDSYDVEDVRLVLAPGATIAGHIVVDGASATGDDGTLSLGQLRITADAIENLPMLGGANARVGDDGSFELANVADGGRILRVRGLPADWTLAAVELAGEDVTDTPLDFGGVGRVDGLRVILSDRVTHLTGRLRNPRGEPLTGYTVLVFPTDERLWQPLSRHVKAARPDQNAEYRIDGLPPADYWLTAVESVQQGEWFDPRLLRQLSSSAMRLSLSAGESRDLDLELNAPLR